MSTSQVIPPETGNACPQEPGYREAFAVLGGLVAGFLVVQVFRTPKIPHFAPGVAAWLTFGPLVALLVIGVCFPRNGAVRFLSSVPFALTAIILTALGAMIGTLILQNPTLEDAQKLGTALPILQRLGFTDVFHAPWFGALIVALVINLALAAGKRIRNLALPGSVFLATHLGTALVLTGGLFGNLTSQQGTLVLPLNTPSANLELDGGNSLDLPSPITLEAFTVEPFPLEISLGVKQEGGILPRKGGGALPSVHPGSQARLMGWSITCETAIPSAEPELKLVEDPSGHAVLELKMSAHGGEAQFPISAPLGTRPLPGGSICELRDIPTSDLSSVVAAAKEGLERHPVTGALYLTDGQTLTVLSRDPQGNIELRTGAEAHKPLPMGGLTLTPVRLHRARLEGTWKSLQGLRTDPTGAAKVIAEKHGVRKEGWIAAGPSGFDWLELEGDTVLMLMPPQPKTFRSDVLVEGRKESLRVNAPLEHHGWQLTQTSFDVSPSGHPISILRAMKDPSIPVVWTGLTLLLLGTLGALWVLPGTLKGSVQ